MTNDGCKVITLFPADELPVANAYWLHVQKTGGKPNLPMTEL